ncbi:AMP-binding protein [Amycolatopsis eburnea]|uniref:AMP-dependent synthetase/ligase domain-containing protein n=1 Tax=Amycolatopsis eburnea TaxID=2267691 RepID=A0A427SVC4_9PSEU|nr:AMP-binding protein [Amycolatopsis eburnea]RSD07775.1 hypothetical protein EIY87_44065 [Amycolatopsis eburnea]
MISAHDHPPGWDTIHGLFERRRRAAPDAVAVCHGGTARTYAELDEAARGLAARLRERGARRGGYVGVLLDRSPELVVALLAVLKSGAAYIGLEPAHPSRRLGVVLRDAGAALVVTRTDLARLLPGDAGPVVLVDEPAAVPTGDGPPAAGARPEDLACVVYASAAAGRPGVMVEHRCVTAFLAALGSRCGPGHPRFAGSTFDAVVGDIFGPLTSGGAVVLPPPGTDPPWLPDRPPSACGAPETTSIAVTAGRPLPAVEVYVLDADLWPVACGAVGELYVGGPTVCRGYLGRPALTAELFGPHPFAREPGARLYRTGDLARVLPDGRLEVVGRTDDHARTP